MTYYRRVGDIPRKRHSLHRVDGAVAAEEMVGEEGFSGPSSLLYHRHSPSAIVSIDDAGIDAAVVHAEPAGRPAPPADDEAAGRAGRRRARRGLRCSATTTCSCSYVTATTTSPLYRNAVGDELVYVQSGSATLESVFGSLAVGGRRLRRRADRRDASLGRRRRTPRLSSCSCCQSRSHIHIPPKYLTPTGQLADGSPYSRARPARPGRPAARRRRGRRGARAHPCRVRPSRPPRPPLRRRRLGRLRLPVGVEHPRLRADRRARSTSRRRCTRRSPAPASSSARSCRATTTSTPTP